MKIRQVDIFDGARRARARERARRRQQKTGQTPFLLARIAEDAAERIAGITRRFDRALIIGPASFSRAVIKAVSEDKRPKQVFTAEDFDDVGRLSKDNKFDLIVTAPVLHSENDPLESLKNLKNSLNPDGALLAALFGEKTLSSLRRAALAADVQYLSGAQARIMPMITYSQLGNLAGAAGFAMPVIDRDTAAVRYRVLQTLVDDLRDMGESNILRAAQPRWPGKDFLARLQSAFPLEDGQFIERFDILWLTGWAPHESQPVPLKPGSAKTSLAGALRGIRQTRKGQARAKKSKALNDE